MTPINEIPAVCNYGTSAVYSDYPSEEQLRAGVVPLDSLPAAWWNKMWCATNGAINEARDMVGQLITEINSVLAQAGICPASACTDQLYQSINLIRQRLATASVPGAVVSSSAAGAINVAQDGTMSVNCLGNIASLTTATSTIVGAINELKTTYDNCFTSVGGAIDTLNQGKAPVGHASTQATYGVGNASCYGHVKLSDSFTAVLDDCEGVAASQYALATVYSCIQASASLGNTAACPLGIASAGCCATAARSDHVHPEPVLKRYPTTFAGYLDCAWDSFISPNTYYEREPGWSARPSTVWCCNWSCTSWSCNVTFIITDAMITSILSQNAPSPIRYYHQNLCGDCKAYVLAVPIFEGSVSAYTTYDASLRVCNCTSNSLLWFCGGVANTWSTRYACTLLYPGQSDYVYGKSYSPTSSHTVAYAYLVYIPTRRQGQPLTAENVGLALNETNRLSLTEGIACSIFTGVHK